MYVVRDLYFYAQTVMYRPADTMIMLMNYMKVVLFLRKVFAKVCVEGSAEYNSQKCSRFAEGSTKNFSTEGSAEGFCRGLFGTRKVSGRFLEGFRRVFWNVEGYATGFCGRLCGRLLEGFPGIQLSNSIVVIK